MYLSFWWAFLLLVPGTVVIGFSLRRRGYGRGQAVIIAALRSATLLVIVLALAGVHLAGRSARRHHVFLIDVSDSCRPNMEAASEFVRSRIARVPPRERVTTLAFARGAVITFQGPGGAAPQIVAPREKLPPGDVTDLGGALRSAASLIDPTEAGILYLISDGLTAEPVSADVLRELRTRGIAVNALATRAGFAADLRLLKVSAPDRVAPGETFSIEVALFCEVASHGAVTVTGPETSLAASVELRPGVPASATLRVTAPSEGIAKYVVSVNGTPDPIGANNRLTFAVSVRGKREIIVIGPGGGFVESVARNMDGFKIRRLSPTPNSPARDSLSMLVQAHLVVIDNVPSDALTPAAAESLRTFVDNLGGGLLMLGGPQSFASGRWSGTDVEQVLPVWCDPRDSHKQPLALVLLMDASGSMAQGSPAKMELAKRAALGAVAALTESDLLGVTTFRMTPEVIVPLGPVDPVEPIRKALFAVNASGGTDMYPALLESISTLAESKQQLKHVLLLSDGKSRPGDVEGALAALRAQKITLSAVVTGAEADRDVLRKLSSGSGGRFYEVRRMSELVHVFLDDLRRIEGPLTRTGGTFQVKPIEALPFPLPTGLTGAPAVSGYNRVRSKEGATVIWQTQPEPDKTEPILVIGRAGLGRTAALMSPPGTDWSGALDAWPGLTPTLAGLMKHLARAADNPDYNLNTRLLGSRVVITVDAEHDGEPINGRRLLLRVESSERAPHVVQLTQAAPGVYSAEMPQAHNEICVLALTDLTDDETGRVIGTHLAAAPYGCEYRRFEPDRATLNRLAKATGGRLFTEHNLAAEMVAPPPRVYHDMTWPLVLLLLALFATEAFLRAFGRI